jgi:hypothetical protein
VELIGEESGWSMGELVALDEEEGEWEEGFVWKRGMRRPIVISEAKEEGKDGQTYKQVSRRTARPKVPTLPWLISHRQLPKVRLNSFDALVPPRYIHHQRVSIDPIRLRSHTSPFNFDLDVPPIPLLLLYIRTRPAIQPIGPPSISLSPICRIPISSLPLCCSQRRSLSFLRGSHLLPALPF